MEDLDYNTDDCIIALATPLAMSALAVIRISGEGCIDVAAPLFQNPQALITEKQKGEGGRIIHNWIIDPNAGEKIDEITLAAYTGGRGYTGEEAMELFVHGSLPGIQRILDVFRRQGFRQASPGEFTFRAYLHKKMDLTRAEAVHELITAKSKEAQNLALNRLSGAVEKKIQEILNSLVEITAKIEVYLDYPEDELRDGNESGEAPLKGEDLKKIRNNLEQLLSSFRVGKIYQEGVPVAIAGRTNAGKSSLFNLFLREDRSIVSEYHGTTRDYLDSWISIRGVPVHLYDTAGLRASEDQVEKEGIRRTEELLHQVFLVLYLVDASIGFSPEEEAQFMEKREDPKWIFLWNKTDIGEHAAPKGSLPVSVTQGEGFKELEGKILERIFGNESAPAGQVVIDSERQKDLLEEARRAILHAEEGAAENQPLDLIALDIREALDLLGQILGEVTTEDILSAMFSRFCVGK